MLAASPDKNVMRSSSEYVKSPAQQASKFMTLQAVKQQTAEQLTAKRFLQMKEAQGLIDIFRDRIENALDEEFSEWTVVDYKGDMTRKAFAKVRVNCDGDFVHVYAVRTGRDEPWSCRYAANKVEGDALEQEEDDYESLPEHTAHCSQMEGACGVCALM
mmetsp:Transcript_107628/g.299819  ORF Transcript_107628/g.299819 Transcript_107628/m.299819 type:complete len:159 (-) Transcript_107628:114-590(-)